jgi:signal transduction histidine kinase/ligand-binding sensor domain-containing protein
VIYEDSAGNLWIGTHAGLDRFDRAEGVFTHFGQNDTDPKSLNLNDVSAICEGEQGHLWIGTEEGGINRFDPTSGDILNFQHDPKDPKSLSHNRVRAIHRDHLGNLWVGTQNGLDFLSLESASSTRGRFNFLHYRHDPFDPNSLGSSVVWSIYEDRSGVMWFGTYGGGLNKYNRSTERFRLYQHHPNLPNSLSDNMIWSIVEDSLGRLWIGTFNGGLNMLDRAADKLVVYRHDETESESLLSDDVRSILEDASGNLWIGTAGGLNRLDPRTNRFTDFTHDPEDPSSLSGNRVNVLLPDKSGAIWVGTRYDGLNRLDPSTGEFTRYQNRPDDPLSLGDDRVWALYEDHLGAVWVGTLNGISVLDPESDQFIRYQHDPQDPNSLSSNSVFSFYEDPDGFMWIGTWGGGLNRFDRSTGTFDHFTEGDGLPNDTIYGIEVDADGHLWMSTNRGLSRFDPRSGTFQNYDVRDGLQDNEFNVGAHFKSESGEMFFGGIQGFNALFPSEIQQNPHVPPIVITTFYKFNQPVRQDLLPNERIELSYKENFVAFEFSALDFNAPDKNRYAYMLEGLDEEWIESGTRRYVSYTNLKAGDYIFLVKGSNSDGVWNEEGIAVRITITPPFWETWWFRGCVLLVLLGSAFGGYRLQVRSTEARRRELEEQVRKRTHELEALYQAEEMMHRYLHLDQVLQTLVDVAVDILQADMSSVLVWDEEREKLVMSVARGFSHEAMSHLSFARDEGAIGYVASSGELVIVEDALTDPRRKDERAEILRVIDSEGIQSFMHLPIKIDDEIFGVFNICFTDPYAFGKDEQRLFLALVQRASLAIENAQLYEVAQELAVVEERQRLARDLHDAVTQTLFSASMIAEVIPRLWEEDPELGLSRLEVLRELTRGALAEMRTLLIELRPAAIAEADLVELMRQLAESTTGRARIPVDLQVEGGCDLTPEVKVVLYRIAQEALNNVAKHAKASRVAIRLVCEDPKVELYVEDDGIGFDPDSVPPDHLGLGIMRERAESIGAELVFESSQNEGTRITLTWMQ